MNLYFFLIDFVDLFLNENRTFFLFWQKLSLFCQNKQFQIINMINLPFFNNNICLIFFSFFFFRCFIKDFFCLIRNYNRGNNTDTNAQPSAPCAL
jgi:hypothetical protein